MGGLRLRTYQDSLLNASSFETLSPQVLQGLRSQRHQLCHHLQVLKVRARRRLWRDRWKGRDTTKKAEDIPYLTRNSGDDEPLAARCPCLTASEFVTSDAPRDSRSMPSALLLSTGFRGRVRGREKGWKTPRVEGMPRLVTETAATWACLTPAAPVALALMSPQPSLGGKEIRCKSH